MLAALPTARGLLLLDVAGSCGPKWTDFLADISVEKLTVAELRNMQRIAPLSFLLNHMTPVRDVFKINFKIILQRTLKSIKWSVRNLSIPRRNSHKDGHTVTDNLPACRNNDIHRVRQHAVTTAVS